MQHSLFEDDQANTLAKASVDLPALDLREHPSANYAPHTGINARGADLTIAFACDFSTAGERLTAKVAGERIVSINLLSFDVESASERVVQALAAHCAPARAVLNVAGNGIATMSRHGYSQRSVDEAVYCVLARVHASVPLGRIRSGGQTGADMSGLVAGVALDVPVLGLWPLGFKQRLVDGKDVLRSRSELEREIEQRASQLRATLVRLDLPRLHGQVVALLESGDAEASERFRCEMGVGPAALHSALLAGHAEALLAPFAFREGVLHQVATQEPMSTREPAPSAQATEWCGPGR